MRLETKETTKVTTTSQGAQTTPVKLEVAAKKIAPFKKESQLKTKSLAPKLDKS